MVLHAHTTKAALLVALTLALAACGKQDAQPDASTPAAASTPAFPTGNGDKVMTLADCDKLPDPKPADDSAAGRAAAVGWRDDDTPHHAQRRHHDSPAGVRRLPGRPGGDGTDRLALPRHGEGTCFVPGLFGSCSAKEV